MERSDPLPPGTAAAAPPRGPIFPSTGVVSVVYPGKAHAARDLFHDSYLNLGGGGDVDYAKTVSTVLSCTMYFIFRIVKLFFFPNIIFSLGKSAYLESV